MRMNFHFPNFTHIYVGIYDYGARKKPEATPVSNVCKRRNAERWNKTPYQTIGFLSIHIYNLNGQYKLYKEKLRKQHEKSCLIIELFIIKVIVRKSLI